MSKVEVKICGIKTRETLEAAVQGGVAYVGFNFCHLSSRYVSPEQAAYLSKFIPSNVKSVAVTVDADDALLQDIFRHFGPDLVQLHGSESPQRAADLRATFKTSIIRALPIETPSDFDAVNAYEDAADYFLFDAASPQGSVLPGGNAISFDWRFLREKRFSKPWFLAGGLSVKNLSEAVALSGASRIDLSSGVERAPGQKDPLMISELLRDPCLRIS
jgi:phosphoribosylanthranilate isomerase